MNPVSSILTRSVTGPFFRRHAGFFLFLFFILFGVYPSLYDVIQVHYRIIEGILTKPSNFLIAVLIWLLYTLRLVTFFYGLTEEDHYAFLQNLNAIESRKRFSYLLKLSIQLFSPILTYGMAIVGIALYKKYLLAGVIALFVLSILTSLIAYSFYVSLQKDKTSSFEIRKYLPGVNSPKTLFSFLMRYIFRDQLLSLTVLKVISFCCLYFFISTDPESYKDRILWLIFTASMIGHFFIVYRNQQFMETQLRLYRNMPVKLFVPILTFLALYFIILIPEFWALKAVAIQHYAYTDYAVTTLTGPCLLLLMHAILYTDDFTMQEMLKLLFGVWIVYFFVGLSDFRWLLPLVSLLMAIIIFYGAYYKYEKKAGNHG